MNRQMNILLAVVWIMGGIGLAEASGSWWQLCDTCTEESHFRYQALNAPGNHTPVYVTNRDTNVTRKYNRFTTTEDMDGTLVQWTEVSPAQFPVAEKSLFGQAVEGANTIFSPIERGDLAAPGLGGNPGSVVGDISEGEISRAFVNAAVLQLEARNLIPTHNSINEKGGLDIFGANYGVGQTTIRKRNLLVKVTYEDGSVISFRLKPDGSIVGWVATDADDKSIPLQPVDGDGPIPINAGGFGDKDFRFGAGNGGHAEALAAWLNGRTGGSLDCTWTPTNDGVAVICPKSN